jgi:hypothetical protein
MFRRKSYLCGHQIASTNTVAVNAADSTAVVLDAEHIQLFVRKAGYHRDSDRSLAGLLRNQLHFRFAYHTVIIVELGGDVKSFRSDCEPSVDSQGSQGADEDLSSTDPFTDRSCTVAPR